MTYCFRSAIPRRTPRERRRGRVPRPEGPSRPSAGGRSAPQLRESCSSSSLAANGAGRRPQAEDHGLFWEIFPEARLSLVLSTRCCMREGQFGLLRALHPPSRRGMAGMFIEPEPP